MDPQSNEIRLTAIVVMLNDERRLRACLGSLGFCRQIIAVDLGSTDRSVPLAREYGAEISHHPRVPIGEFVLPQTVPLARNEWILRFDPDEVFVAPLAEKIRQCILEHANAAMIRLPHQYYFLNSPLRTTVWGGTNHIPRVFHRDRVEFRPYVHDALRAKSGFTLETADSAGLYPVQHYWIENFHQLFEKHFRYIALEGPTRFGRGERFSWRRFARETLFSFYLCFVKKCGWRGGWRGIFLSFFYGWYVAMGHLSLRQKQKSINPSPT